MPLKLHELERDDDFKAVVEVEHEAYSNPFNGVWEITKGLSQEECCARQLSWHKNDPHSTWLYVTDEETGQVVGGAQWFIYKTNPYAVEQPMRTAYWLPDGPMKHIGDQLIRDLRKDRPSRMSKPHLCAASLMLKWGTDKADELGLEAFVESTDIARRAYEKQGFYVVGELNMDAHVENPSEEFSAVREQFGCPIHGWVMKRDVVSTQ
ncbi:hypothetical protein GGR53DRAFT_463675 [Hypoxylon sp. FL1150]|nr:hypothetical protein GGR53DRAFT_463675 [Hypoxylon sp. FL1150]